MVMLMVENAPIVDYGNLMALRVHVGTMRHVNVVLIHVDRSTSGDATNDNPNIIARSLHRLTGTTDQRFPDLGLARSRVACAAAIVCGCILLCGLAMILLASFPLRPAAADLHVVAGFFLKG
jgi:hypothetical protein